MKLTYSIFPVIALSLSTLTGKCQTPNLTVDANRVERTQKKYKELFGSSTVLSATDPELMTILQRFIFGEVFYTGTLDDKLRELITITALATNQTFPQLKVHTAAALNIGVTPVQIREVIYQLSVFIGFPKVLNAMDTINAVFKNRGINLPLPDQGTVTEANRFENGRKQQEPLYGSGMKKSMSDMPGVYADFIPNMLTETCFGDFYTRGGLELQTRELMIFCALATLGGTERQMTAHAEGNMKVGNTKEILVAAMVQCYPYIGFPRISNAISCIRDAKPEPVGVR